MASSQKDKNPSIGRKEYYELLHFSFSRGALHHPWFDHELKFTPDHCELEGKIKLRYLSKIALDFCLILLRLAELFELYTTWAIIEAKTTTNVRAQDRAWSSSAWIIKRSAYVTRMASLNSLSDCKQFRIFVTLHLMYPLRSSRWLARR